MGSLNKVMLIGRLGKDPEIRYTQSGNAVAHFSIATSDSWNDQQGQRQERTEWHNIVAWNKLADLAQNYLKQGSQIYLEGRLQTSSWDDQQTGQKRYKTEINARTIQFLDSRPSDGGNNAYTPPQQQMQPPQNTPYQQGNTMSGNVADRSPGPPPRQQQQHQGQPQGMPNPNQNQNQQYQGPPPPDSFIEDDIPF